MTPPFRFLGQVNSSSPPPPVSYDSDFVIILAALLCALICVLGLLAVARCAWMRHLSGLGRGAPNVSGLGRGASTATIRIPTPPLPPNKGLKKKVLRSLPKLTFSQESSAEFSDCAICLTEFSSGEEFRVLPQCGHGFHVACIDTWLRSYSSCPSCRQILVVSRCQKCGSLPSSSSGGGDMEGRRKEREDDVNGFLP